MEYNKLSKAPFVIMKIRVFYLMKFIMLAQFIFLLVFIKSQTLNSKKTQTKISELLENYYDDLFLNEQNPEWEEKSLPEESTQILKIGFEIHTSAENVDQVFQANSKKKIKITNFLKKFEVIEENINLVSEELKECNDQKVCLNSLIEISLKSPKLSGLVIDLLTNLGYKLNYVEWHDGTTKVYEKNNLLDQAISDVNSKTNLHVSILGYKFDSIKKVTVDEIVNEFDQNDIKVNIEYNLSKDKKAVDIQQVI